LAVATISLRQGCPSRGGIWRKSEAKPWPEEYELHIRPHNPDEFASQNEIQYYQKMVW